MRVLVAFLMTIATPQVAWPAASYDCVMEVAIKISDSGLTKSDGERFMISVEGKSLAFISAGKLHNEKATIVMTSPSMEYWEARGTYSIMTYFNQRLNYARSGTETYAFNAKCGRN